MSEEIVSRCGYRCDLCLAYQPNVQQHDRRNELNQRIVRRDNIEHQLERKLTESEYCRFVLPYESKPRLDDIRDKLKKDHAE